VTAWGSVGDEFIPGWSEKVVQLIAVPTIGADSFDGLYRTSSGLGALDGPMPVKVWSGADEPPEAAEGGSAGIYLG